MKSRRKFVAFVLACVIIVSASVSTLRVFAHDAMLDVDYDDCVSEMWADGIDEMWYILNKDASCYHISHEIDTIRYYFADSTEGSTYTWTTDVTASVAQEIKSAYAASMKKWNNIYFYSYDNNGILEKHKIIQVVEGTKANHNLTIYPVSGQGSLATTGAVGTNDEIESGAVSHRHYSNWEMKVNINYFYVHDSYNQTYIDTVRERTGAHEVGHVLGLKDVDADNSCNATENARQHHHELLMGYGRPMSQRSVDITYKDVAGVAITRGFHTDSDHKWLNFGLQNDGRYKLVCSICNGVEKTPTLSGYTYKTYGACGNHHNLSDGNMIAVASYGTKDYYKCEYCRYVASFDSNVKQNYSKTNYTSALHKCVNNVNGLEYTFYEEHAPYIYVDKYYHRRKCSCEIGMQKGKHTISASDVRGGNFAPCMGCGYLLDLRDDYYNSIASITQVSINGSYILPCGIIVLVDEDIEAYLDETLVFYPANNVPTAQ